MALTKCASGTKTQTHSEASRTASSQRAFGTPKFKFPNKQRPDKSLETFNSTIHGKPNSHFVMSSNNNDNTGNSGQKDKDNNDDGSDSDDEDNEHRNSSGHSLPQGGLPPFRPFFGPCSPIDENDGQMQFTGTWSLNITGSPSPLHPMSTHTTYVAGSTATISFNGTRVSIMGVVHGGTTPPPASAQYTIDGNSVELPLPISMNDIPHQTFYQSPILSAGNHNLTILVTTSGSPYTIESLLVCNDHPHGGDGSAALSAKPLPETSKKLAAGAIAAIVIGCLGFVVLCCVAIVLFHRRQRRLRSARTADSPITQWLDRRLSGTLFTSSTSIMRNTPSNLSAPSPGPDLFDKSSTIEKFDDEMTSEHGAIDRSSRYSVAPTPRNSRIHIWRSKLRRSPSIGTLHSWPASERHSGRDPEPLPPLPAKPSSA